MTQIHRAITGASCLRSHDAVTNEGNQKQTRSTKTTKPEQRAMPLIMLVKSTIGRVMMWEDHTGTFGLE